MFFKNLKVNLCIYLYAMGNLDGALLLAAEYNDCVRTFANTISRLNILSSFVVHPSKSVLSPTQEITNLGFIIISKEMAVRLTENRKFALAECCVVISKNCKNKIRDIARLLGQMIATFIAVPVGPLQYITESYKKRRSRPKK